MGYRGKECGDARLGRIPGGSSLLVGPRMSRTAWGPENVTEGRVIVLRRCWAMGGPRLDMTRAAVEKATGAEEGDVADMTLVDDSN
jgi:hypothetical protein